MKLLITIFSIIYSMSCLSQVSNICSEYSHNDSLIYSQVANKYTNYTDNIGSLIINIASDFINTPYVANTLEINSSEKLVSNLSAVDCTTFIEYVLAISRSIKHNDVNYNSFLNELKLIRYRNGLILNYSSRLHYFSDWLYDNMHKNVVSFLDSSFQTNFNKQINFMSTNSENYLMLKNDSILLSKIKYCEDLINSKKYFYIPKNKIINIENKLQNGDIIGITTSIKGLDISHVGFIIIKNGHAHLLHASSSLKKVVISDKTLYNYLIGMKSTTGIMVARPL